MQNTLTFNPLSDYDQKAYAGASESARIAHRTFPGATVTVVADDHEDSDAITVDIADENGKTLIYGATYNPETLEAVAKRINSARTIFEVIYFVSLNSAFTLSGSL